MKYRSRWVAALLASVSPCGLAQLYNGQSRKAAVFFVMYWAIIIVTLFSGVAVSLGGGAVLLLLNITFVVIAIGDAVKNAGREIPLRRYNKWYFFVTFYVATLIIISIMKSHAVIEAFKMAASSMKPTISPGENFIVDKRAGIRKVLQHGDIIVFKYPQDQKLGSKLPSFIPRNQNKTGPKGAEFSRDKRKAFVKRVIGLPGDRVRTEGTELYVNGKKLQHSIIKEDGGVTIMTEELDHHHYTIQHKSDRIFPDQEYIVPEGQLFVMGDNRDSSADSREWGFLSLATR